MGVKREDSNCAVITVCRSLWSEDRRTRDAMDSSESCAYKGLWVLPLQKEAHHSLCLICKVSVITADPPEPEELGEGDAVPAGLGMAG